MSVTTRSKVLRQLADAICYLHVTHPTRVAIDGRSGAGKTTLADELAEVIRGLGHEVLRACFDDFHRVGHKYRSQWGEWTPKSYYDEGYDYQALCDLLLRPLGPHGDRRCRTGILDSYHDTLLPEEWHHVSRNAIILIDGVFLLRRELAVHWDYIIWLDIDWNTMLERTQRRDVARVGSEQAVLERYKHHWIHTHQFYEHDTPPRESAHAVVDNRCIENPRILTLSALPNTVMKRTR